MSTAITVQGKIVDLATLPLEKLIKARNAVKAMLEARQYAGMVEDPFGYYMGNVNFLKKLERAIEKQQFPQRYQW